ncbi:MAG: DHH family phosphoesterase [Candidatus Omnitrophica bacterium]|nr:DHH family phosphoesterase [Candidatus Omnitrophota bacterium]
MKRQQLPRLIKEILSARGFKTEKSMAEFIHSGISSLSEPFSIPSMKEACEALKKTLLNKKKVFIYGDGDADGICSVYLLLKFFETVAHEAPFRLTHRLDEDYEIEDSLICELAEEGYSLLISVDCGISSVSALKKAAEAGIKCVILDHHIGDSTKLPEQHVYVNPFTGGKWPEGARNLSGAGIVFKFIEGMAHLLPGMRENHFYDLIEIVCLSVLADFLPLTGENRIFVREGLQRLPFTGIGALAYFIEELNLQAPLNQKDVTMKINPKLNSPGRLGKPEVALSLLMEDDRERIRHLKDEIDRMDRKRYQNVAKEMQNLANYREESAGFIISESISPGICGIVASRLAERHNRPYLVGCKTENFMRGSIRAPKGYNLYEKLKPVDRYMHSLGGHAGAMGFKCGEEYLGKIRKFWEEIEWEPEPSGSSYDCILDIEELTPELIKEINEYLEPFGKGNPEPVFMCRDVVVKGIFRSSRKEKRSFWIKKKNSIYESFLSDGVNASPENGEKINIFYSPRIKGIKGLYRIFLVIKDYCS